MSDRLLNRNFLLFWQGQLVSRLGSQIYTVAMVFWVKHTTGSASWVGVLMMLATLPVALLSPLGGVVADHYSRRRILVLTDAGAGLTMVVLGGAMLFFPKEPSLLRLAFMTALLLGVLRAFFVPAAGATLPDLVPSQKVQQANSLYSFGSKLAELVGQGVGGFLYTAVGAPVMILVNGISYLFSAFSESFIVVPPPAGRNDPPSDRRDMARESMDRQSWGERLRLVQSDLVFGFRFITARRGLTILALMAAAINFLVAPYIVLLPFWVEDVLRAAPAWYGYVLASIGVGSLVGFLAAGALPLEGRQKSWGMITALILMSLAIALPAFVSDRFLALVAVAGFGVTNGFFNVHLVSLIQLATPAELRGRVLGLLGSLVAALTPIGMALGGVATDLIGGNVALIYAVCGGLAVLTSISAALVPDFRSFLALTISADQQPPDEPPSGELLSGEGPASLTL